MLEFSIGLVLGLAVGFAVLKHSIKLQENRIKDYEHFSNQRIHDFHNSFTKGYETRNGFQPFQKVEGQPETYVMDDQTLYEMENADKPVEEEVDERDFHQTR